MADRTGISWTDATWNPVTGCTKVSPGCDHCYAETIAHRFAGTKAYPAGFAVTLRPERLDQPLRWTRPRRVFVNSMSDLFHADIPDEYIARVFAVMALAPRHTFQVLTKRHARMRSLLNSKEFRTLVARRALARAERDPGPPYLPEHLVIPAPGESWWPLPNVWLGVSVEDQRWADIRVPALLDTPAVVRFLSCEPLLGPVSLARWQHLRPLGANFAERPMTPSELRACGMPALHWVIVGGESGRGARPMHPDWARQLRDQCTAAGVAFHFKQWGEWGPGDEDGMPTVHRGQQKPDVLLLPNGEGTTWAHRREATVMHRYGKRDAGRELDGRTWDEEPTR